MISKSSYALRPHRQKRNIASIDYYIFDHHGVQLWCPACPRICGSTSIWWHYRSWKCGCFSNRWCLFIWRIRCAGTGAFYVLVHRSSNVRSRSEFIFLRRRESIFQSCGTFLRGVYCEQSLWRCCTHTSRQLLHLWCHSAGICGRAAACDLWQYAILGATTTVQSGH